MAASSGFGTISALGHTTPIYKNTDREVYTHHAQSPYYDSVSISSAPTGESRFQMDVVSRLAKEVRTSTTIGEIQTLRQQVASGTYVPDPMAIAARIMFLGEGR